MSNHNSNTKILGVIGGGQLGRMLALAAAPLGVMCRFYDPDSKPPAFGYGSLTAGDFKDLPALRAFAQNLPQVTCEFENIPADHIEALSQLTTVWPPAAAFRTAQDRVTEKFFFNQLGIATAPYRAVNSLPDLEAAATQVGFPAVLKTRRLGYDGKGQAVLRSAADLPTAFAAVGGHDLILEGFVAFERELSLIAVRGVTGETAFYPLIENQHESGILRQSLMPAPQVSADLQKHAEEIGKAALSSLSYVGVLVIEFFQRGQELIVNEMAPRVHNSGHLTVEGAETSQFENHVRAVMGWPLGSTAVARPVAMLNLIGNVPSEADVLRQPGAHLHLYNKAPRPGRKLGHITITAPNAELLDQRLKALRPFTQFGSSS